LHARFDGLSDSSSQLASALGQMVYELRVGNWL